MAKEKRGFMRSVRLSIISVTVALFAFGGVAVAKQPGFSATIGTGGLPEVQRVGESYIVTMTVRKPAKAWLARFCVDFGDDHGSWKIVMPGMTAYDDDVYCYGTLRTKVKRFVARLIPAKTGQKKLEICFGSAEIFKEANNAVIDENGKCWSDSFVLA